MSSGTVVIDVRQSYVLLSQPSTLSSRLVVCHDDDGRIGRIEERWNRVGLLTSFPFRMSRSVNGKLAYWMTSSFLSERATELPP